MNNILLVHFKRFGDLVSTSQLVAGIKSQYPHTDISLVCFDEFSSVAKLIPGLKKVYTINRESLLTLTKGQLYSTGFAIDELRKKVLVLSKESWDKVINLSNDRASSHFCSWLSTSNPQIKVKGIRIDQHNLAVASDFWALTYNDILTRSTTNSPFNFRDIWSRMVGVEETEKNCLLTNQRNEDTVSRNFNKIREVQGKIVGIQVHCSVDDKGFSDEFSAEICDQLSVKSFVPVLIIAPNDVERGRAKTIADTCLTRPIIVECDFTALSSVVKNIDALITPDTVTKHFADAWNTPCLEISLGSSPTFKQATLNPKSLLIIPTDRKLASVNISDVMNALNLLFNPNPNSYVESNACNIYSPVRLSSQTVYQSRSTKRNDKVELDRHASVVLLNKIANINDTNEKEIRTIALTDIYDNKRAKQWFADVEETVTAQTRDVLHAIRSLLQMKENPKKSSAFIESLDRLLSFTEQLNTATISAVIFRSKLESLPPTTFADNARSLEALLFEYKANLQSCLNLVQSWEVELNNSRKENRSQRQQSI